MNEEYETKQLYCDVCNRKTIHILNENGWFICMECWK